MLSKFVFAAVAVAASSAHSINTRQAPIYSKVNRDSEYGAPSAPSYSAPAPSYSAPAPSYSAPAPSYDAPAPSYSAPEASYGAPSTGYGAPSYEEEAGLDLTSIIIPLLALVGLSLLFPTYVSLTTVRKRREADQGWFKNTPFFLCITAIALYFYTHYIAHYYTLCTANSFAVLL